MTTTSTTGADQGTGGDTARQFSTDVRFTPLDVPW